MFMLFARFVLLNNLSFAGDYEKSTKIRLDYKFTHTCVLDKSRIYHVRERIKGRVARKPVRDSSQFTLYCDQW